MNEAEFGHAIAASLSASKNGVNEMLDSIVSWSSAAIHPPYSDLDGTFRRIKSVGLVSGDDLQQWADGNTSLEKKMKQNAVVKLSKFYNDMMMEKAEEELVEDDEEEEEEGGDDGVEGDGAW